MKSVLFAAVILVGGLSSFAGETTSNSGDSIFDVRDWAYSRERKTLTGSNRVTGTINLKNVSKSPASDVTLTLTLASGLGEKVADPIVQKAGVMKPGEKKAVTFVAEFIPIFSSYTISIQFNGNKKEEWHGNSDTGQPESKNAPARGQAVVAILGKEVAADKSGAFAGKILVKNEGTEDAKNAKIVVTFFDMKKNKLKDWTGPLGNGTVAAGAEQQIPFSVPNAPKNYGSYSIKVNHDDAPPEVALSGGEFSNIEDVEFAHFKFSRAEKKDAPYKVEADCRNGLKVAVDHLKLEMIFYGANRREVKRLGHEFPGSFAPGETRPVSFEIAGLPAYEEYEQSVSYGNAAAPAKGAAVAPTGKPAFQNKPDVEVVFGSLALNADKVVEIIGAVRNGRKNPIKDVAIRMTLLKSDGSELTSVDRTMPAVLKPGEEKEITVYVENAANAANYRFTFKFVETADKKPAEKNPLDFAL